MRVRLTFLCVAWFLAAMPARAQSLPDKPIQLAGGQVTVSGEVVGAIAPRDDRSFFDYTDYEHNALRLFRVSFTGSWHPSDRFAVLAEIRSEDLEVPIAYALYVRVRPWKDRAFDVQAGRIPPVFGAFGRRAYAYDNPLIGYPLAYQYLTSLRPDALPATADDLLAVRAHGWRAVFPVGNPASAPGVPVMSVYRWDTGVEGHLQSSAFDIAASVTTGTLSDPRIDDDNGGRQVAARVAWHPIVGLIVGASAARGDWVSDAVKGQLPQALQNRSYPQTALGMDAEYSRGYFVVRGELIASRWTLPALDAPVLAGPVRATGAYLEGQYRLTPRFFAAARVDHLGFSRITGTRFGGAPTPWDAPVSRVEAGGGVYLQRNVIGRVVVQRNWREAGAGSPETFVSGQLSYWF
ncbi:MAG TPA: hypothetical protein VFX12_13815 [Vicinamibacterales bacterium]|nr:hypothetical protein [Vicinamibacterales bacterium]